MEKRILVPLDGSPAAETALADAAAIAGRRGCGLLLLHVVALDKGERTYRFHRSAAQPAGEVVDHATAYLQGVQQRLADHGVTAELLVDEGDPAVRIIHHVERDESVEMVAMATHGRGGIRRLLMGSVADKVFRATHKPLLLLRPEETAADQQLDKQYQTILVPLDGSPTAAQALWYAQELAEEMQARLVLVGVAPELEDLLLGVGDTLPLWMDDSLQKQKADLRDYLATAAANLASARLPVETRVVSGLPAEAILKACQDDRADILVISSHGRSGFQRLWYGSVATKLVHSAHVPLLLINAGAAG
jgi:nucleotide-binding universal stress UspA family protein